MKARKDKCLHRIKIIKGQIKGVEKMIEENKYCVDILTQSLAIQNALKELDRYILEDHIKSCVLEDIKKGKAKKTVEELMAVYALSKKS